MASAEHAEVQRIAKRVLVDLAATFTPRDTERSIAARATEMLAAHGIRDTWYYDCPALVLLGSRSCVSVSGRNYVPADEPVGVVNVVTVDLSPASGDIWGDCARSFFVEDGRATDQPQREDFRAGREAERRLHSAMQTFVRRATTFADLHAFGNAEVERHGYENLDYRANLGHSIETTLAGRRYIERGNNDALGTAAFFTFEPHIRRKGEGWGFKHEDIYYFDASGTLKVL